MKVFQFVLREAKITEIQQNNKTISLDTRDIWKIWRVNKGSYQLPCLDDFSFQLYKSRDLF